METQRILMRSLAVVVFASVIWTITVSADAQQKVGPCCTAVSSVKLTDPIIGFRIQNESLPCVKAVIFKTEKQDEFCCDWRQPWVKEKVMQFLRARRNKRLTSTPASSSSSSSSSSVSDVTRVGGSTQSSDSS